MADRLMGGTLRERLSALRDEGRSFEDISRVLYAEKGVEVGARTLFGWAKALGIGEEAVA